MGSSLRRAEADIHYAIPRDPNQISFNAASDVPPEFRFVDSNHGLEVKGIAIGAIEKLSEPLEFGDAEMRRARARLDRDRSRIGNDGDF